MKKRCIFTLSIIAILLLSSCTSKGTASVVSNGRNKAEAMASNETHRVLVAYYSETGNTKRVAEVIANELDGDLLELEPVDEYTSADLNYRNNDSRVSKEHDNPELRDMDLKITTPESWDSYDVVFIGYPIWWGIAAWPVNGFIEDNDFTGKTVIPFATSASSGLGQSVDRLRELSSTGDWQDGRRFQSRASESDIREWIASLGL